MSGKPASSLSSILEFCLSSEGDHQIVDRGHDFAGIARGHSSGIFMEGHWIGSEILIYEIKQNPDSEIMQRVLSLSLLSDQVDELTDKVSTRAEELENAGFDSYDAIHLASAEHANVDVFLTTVDQIVKVANRNRKLLAFLIENPVK